VAYAVNILVRHLYTDSTLDNKYSLWDYNKQINFMSIPGLVSMILLS